MDTITDKSGNTLLHMDITAEVAIKLIKMGANVNTKNNNGYHPLHFAIHNDNFDLVKVLVENGAHKVISNNNIYSPKIIEYLAQNDFPLKDEYILNYGSDEQKRKIKVTFDQACLSFENTKRYIEQGNDINTQGTRGLTILHHAVRRENDKWVRYLIDIKADQFIKDKDGDVPVNYIVDNYKIYDILKDSIDVPNNKNKTIMFRTNNLGRIEHLIYLGGNTVNDKNESIYDKYPDLMTFEQKLKFIVKGREKEAIKIIMSDI